MLTILSKDIIDEYARLDAELDGIRPKVKRHAELAKTLRAACGSDPERASSAITLRGRDYDVIAGACELKSVFAPIAKIYRVLGKDTFLKVASVTLAALKAHVHPATVADLVSQERTGPRSLVVMRRKETKAA